MYHGIECLRPPHCANCGEDHPASSKDCFFFILERETLKIQVKERKSYYDSKRIASQNLQSSYSAVTQRQRPVPQSTPKARPTDPEISTQTTTTKNRFESLNSMETVSQSTPNARPTTPEISTQTTTTKNRFESLKSMETETTQQSATPVKIPYEPKARKRSIDPVEQRNPKKAATSENNTGTPKVLQNAAVKTKIPLPTEEKIKTTCNSRNRAQSVPREDNPLQFRPRSYSLIPPIINSGKPFDTSVPPSIPYHALPGHLPPPAPPPPLPPTSSQAIDKVTSKRDPRFRKQSK